MSDCRFKGGHGLGGGEEKMMMNDLFFFWVRGVGEGKTMMMKDLFLRGREGEDDDDE